MHSLSLVRNTLFISRSRCNAFFINIFTNQFGNLIKNAIEVTTRVNPNYSNVVDFISFISMERNEHISGVKYSNSPNKVVRIQRV